MEPSTCSPGRCLGSSSLAPSVCWVLTGEVCRPIPGAALSPRSWSGSPEDRVLPPQPHGGSQHTFRREVRQALGPVAPSLLGGAGCGGSRLSVLGALQGVGLEVEPGGDVSAGLSGLPGLSSGRPELAGGLLRDGCSL